MDGTAALGCLLVDRSGTWSLKMYFFFLHLLLLPVPPDHCGAVIYESRSFMFLLSGTSTVSFLFFPPLSLFSSRYRMRPICCFAGLGGGGGSFVSLNGSQATPIF